MPTAIGSSGLADLPNELFEYISLCLTLGDIRHLRRVSRDIASRASQDHFASFFRKKNVDITRFTSHRKDAGAVLCKT